MAGKVLSSGRVSQQLAAIRPDAPAKPQRARGAVRDLTAAASPKAPKGASARAASVRTGSLSSIFHRALNSSVAREIAALSMLAAVAFLVLSIVSFDAADLPAAVWPANEKAANLGGRIGANLIGWLYQTFGVATYMLVGLMAVWAGVIFLRRNLESWPLKLFGALLAVIAFAGFFGSSHTGSLTMPSSGGVIGTALHGVLSANFGLAGTYLILTFIVAVSVLLATDILFYPLVRDFFAAPDRDDEEGGDIVFEKSEQDIEFHAAPDLAAAFAAPEKPAGFFRRMLERVGLASSRAAAASGVHPDLAEPPDTSRGSSLMAAAVAPMVAQPAAEKPTSPQPPKPAPVKPAKAKKAKPAAAAEPVQPTLEELAKAYQAPATELLEASAKSDPSKATRETDFNRHEIIKTLAHFKIEAKIEDIRRGPTVTLYELSIPPNVPVRNVVKIEDNLQMMLQAQAIRIIAPIPGRSTIGIEVPNKVRDAVSLREVVTSEAFQAAARKMELPIAIGLDAEGKPLVRDLTKAPHLLIAGTTGSGKSVMENIILCSLLLSRHWQDVRLMLVDPKTVELTPYEELGFLAAPVITDMHQAVGAFEWLVEEMERRYAMLAKTGTKKITEFNEMDGAERRVRYAAKGGDPGEIPDRMPYIVVMVDEFADMMMVNADTRVDELVQRIAQKARAAGIHLILATQRPSADVITGVIKANIPARIGFRLPTQVDSRTIINSIGAEKLLSRGDMLLDWGDGTGLIRAQSAFCDTPEIDRICKAVRTQTVTDYFVNPAKRGANPAEMGEMIGGQPKHEKFDEAVSAILCDPGRRASAQFLRSALRVGYNAATTLIMQLEKAGVLGPARGAKEREVLVTWEEWQARIAGADAEGEEGDADGDSDAESSERQVAAKPVVAKASAIGGKARGKTRAAASDEDADGSDAGDDDSDVDPDGDSDDDSDSPRSGSVSRAA
jgi:S-DNA-T family DNA segregation ATPase FtsK/SpoIIIE